MNDRPRRRTGVIVLSVTFAPPLAGAGGVAALLVAERTRADRARTAQVAELEKVRAELSAQKTSLVYASTERDQARLKYEREVARAERDRACVEYIRGILNEMKRRSSISVQYSNCAE